MACLARAQKENDDQLYAGIFSCIVLLTDHGAKAVVTVFDEYTFRPPPTVVVKKAFRTTLSTPEMHTPLNICGGDSDIALELEADVPSELSTAFNRIETSGNYIFEPLSKANRIKISYQAYREIRRGKKYVCQTCHKSFYRLDNLGHHRRLVQPPTAPFTHVESR
jgi:hypothetical protein